MKIEVNITEQKIFGNTTNAEVDRYESMVYLCERLTKQIKRKHQTANVEVLIAFDDKVTIDGQDETENTKVNGILAIIEKALNYRVWEVSERGETLDPNCISIVREPGLTDAEYAQKCAYDAGQVARERSGKPEK